MGKMSASIWTRAFWLHRRSVTHRIQRRLQHQLRRLLQRQRQHPHLLPHRRPLQHKARWSISTGTYSVNEDAGFAPDHCDSNWQYGGKRSVVYSSLNVSASGFSDYTGLAGTLTFAAGQSSKTFTISIINDTINEGNETFNLFVEWCVERMTVSSSVTSITIMDNDGRA